MKDEETLNALKEVLLLIVESSAFAGKTHLDICAVCTNKCEVVQVAGDFLTECMDLVGKIKRLQVGSHAELLELIALVSELNLLYQKSLLLQENLVLVYAELDGPANPSIHKIFEQYRSELRSSTTKIHSASQKISDLLTKGYIV